MKLVPVSLSHRVSFHVGGLCPPQWTLTLGVQPPLPVFMSPVGCRQSIASCRAVYMNVCGFGWAGLPVAARTVDARP